MGLLYVNKTKLSLTTLVAQWHYIDIMGTGSMVRSVGNVEQPNPYRRRIFFPKTMRQASENILSIMSELA